MKNIIYCVIFMFFILNISFSQQEKTPGRLYPFVCKESTGDNKYILIDDRLKPIREFSQASNANAIAAIKSLKYGVLYPNSDGAKIFLKGEYDSKEGIFTLIDWFIVAPFVTWEVIDEAALPHEYKSKIKNKLSGDDFSVKIDNPEKFVVPISKIEYQQEDDPKR